MPFTRNRLKEYVRATDVLWPRTKSALACIAVRVQTTDAPIAPADVMPTLYWSAPEADDAPLVTDEEQEEQQQQQQQQ